MPRPRLNPPGGYPGFPPRPRRLVWPWIVGGLGTLLIVGLIIAPRSGNTPPAATIAQPTTTATPAEVINEPTYAVAPEPTLAQIGQTVSNRGITLTVTAARTADTIEMNESNFRPGSGFDEYTKTKPEQGGKFVVIETHIVNNAQVSLDLTCGYPVATKLIDAQNRNFDPIQNLYKLKGNPECNKQLQPGFEIDMTWVYLMPAGATVAGWGFQDVTDFAGTGNYTLVQLAA